MQSHCLLTNCRQCHSPGVEVSVTLLSHVVVVFLVVVLVVLVVVVVVLLDGGRCEVTAC